MRSDVFHAKKEQGSCSNPVDYSQISAGSFNMDDIIRFSKYQSQLIETPYKVCAKASRAEFISSLWRSSCDHAGKESKPFAAPMSAPRHEPLPTFSPPALALASNAFSVLSEYFDAKKRSAGKL